MKWLAAIAILFTQVSAPIAYGECKIERKHSYGFTRSELVQLLAKEAAKREGHALPLGDHRLKCSTTACQNREVIRWNPLTQGIRGATFYASGSSTDPTAIILEITETAPCSKGGSQ